MRVVVDRIDPALFEACFAACALSLFADAGDAIRAQNMALVRGLAFNLVNLVSSPRSGAGAA